MYKDIYGKEYREPKYSKFGKRTQKIQGKKVMFNDKKIYLDEEFQET